MIENQKLNKIIDYSKELMSAGPDSPVGKGLELSLSTVIGKTLTKRLPVPLNYVVPLVFEKVILLHGVDAGRDVLINVLRWVKLKTEPDTPVISVN